jgi:hypothetical protein
VRPTHSQKEAGGARGAPPLQLLFTAPDSSQVQLGAGLDELQDVRSRN